MRRYIEIHQNLDEFVKNLLTQLQYIDLKSSFEFLYEKAFWNTVFSEILQDAKLHQVQN